ncbi:MAG: 16S rRNA (uracil(1498)-N(3))-methyltransferase [Bacteroidia bacterium]
MHLFYTPDIESELYTFPEEESKHAVRVLRLQKGDSVQLTDGKGNLYTAEISDDHPKRCQVHITSRQAEYGKRGIHLHIAMAPTKSMDRTEWFLEKAVEIGLEEFTPITCEHSERTTMKTDRLHKIAVSAMKQSIKAIEPVLNENVSFIKFIERCRQAGGQKFIAHCNRSSSEPDTLKSVYKPGTDSIILIGPEGDFSEQEINLALQNGFTAVSLGKSRLRTETAALAACHTIHLLNE